MKGFLRKSWKVFRATVVILSLTFFLAVWALRTAWMQARIIPIVENVLENSLGAPVEVGMVDIALPAKAVLRDVVMKDQQGHRMFAIQEVRVSLASFSLLKFIFNPSATHFLRLNQIDIIQPEAHLYKQRRDGKLNMAFLTESQDTSSGDPMQLDLHLPRIRIRGGMFTYVDSTLSDSALAVNDRVNFSNLHLRRFHTEVSFHLHEDQRMTGWVRDLGVTDDHSLQFVNEFSSHYEINPEVPGRGMLMCFEDTRVRTGATFLDLDGQVENVAMHDSLGFVPAFAAQFRPSTFSFQTLNYLLQEPLPMRSPAMIEGYVAGGLDRLHSDSLFVGFFDKTRLHTEFDLYNYTKAPELRFVLDIYDGAVSFDELNRFLRVAEIPLAGVAKLHGKVVGSLDDIRSNNLRVDYMNDTRLKLRAHLLDYTKGDDMFMDVKFRHSRLNFGEIRQLLPTMTFPSWMDNFGQSEVHGSYIGGINDFVINAGLLSDHGEVQANLHLRLPPRVGRMSYNGLLSTRNLNLDALKAEDAFHTRYLNFDGRVEGEGTDFNTMVATIDGKVLQSDIEGYHIDQLVTKDVRIDSAVVSGGLELTDAQGNASLNFEVEYHDSIHRYNLFGDIGNLDLDHYGIMPGDSVLLTSIVNVRLAGDSIENYTGRTKFFAINMVRQRSTDSLQLRNVILRSDIDEQMRHKLELKSSVARMNLRGAFTYRRAIDVVSRIVKETQLFIKNNDTLSQNYYAEKVFSPGAVTLWDTITTKSELNDLMAFFKMPIYVEPESKAYIQLDHSDMDFLNMAIHSDSLAFSGIGLRGNALDLQLEKDGRSDSLISVGLLSTAELHVNENLRFQDLSFEGTADEKSVDYFLRARQKEIGNDYVISAETEFLDSSAIHTFIHAGASRLRIKGRDWRFARGNLIRRLFETPPSLDHTNTDSIIPRFHISGLKLVNEGQEISLEGIVSSDFMDIVNLNVKNVRIGSLLEVLETPIDMDGTIRTGSVGGWNLFEGQPYIFGAGEIDHFRYMNADSIGIRFYGGWPYLGGPDYAGIRLELGHWGHDSLVVKGWYNVAKDSLNFAADSSRILLSWLEPFLDGVLSDMRGKVGVDRFTVTGALARPRLQGIARLYGAGFHVDYLNNFFSIGDNELNFNNERVEVSQIVIQDTAKNSAQLNGKVWYNDTAGVRMNFALDRIRNLTFMDTRAEDNDAFYGKVVLNGDSARVRGTLDDLRVEAWVNTGKNSWLDIPLSDYTSASRLDFVRFIREGDTLQTDRNVNLGGIEMSITVHATRDAKVRLIFDEQAGDIIQARGDGTLTLNIDKDGEMTMFGTYVIEEGGYQFTAENILKKQFVIDKGGRIVWNGTPYEAQMDLNAVYKVNASLGDLLQGAGNQRVPVDIIMRLKGSLLKPEINLELRLDQLSDQDVLGLASYFRGIQYDEAELNKQVVSLLLFRRFTRNSNYFASGAPAGGVTSSVSELISNQVNFWISRAFDDANVGVELNSNEFQDVELALSATLFNDKVTVERNGTIIGNGNSSVIGDLSVQIKLLPVSDTSKAAYNPNSGALVMEVFNREEATVSNNNNISRGVGLFYKKDFDRLSDLFKKKNKGKGRKEEE